MEAFLLYGSNPKTTDQADKTCIFITLAALVLAKVYENPHYHIIKINYQHIYYWNSTAQ